MERKTIDPLHVGGNATNLEYRSKNFFWFVLQIGCIPTDVHGVYRGLWFCMKIYLISQGRENVLFLPSNLAAMTSHENTPQANTSYKKNIKTYCNLDS